ncbi:MAG TPA: PH domain-containing protein [Candidatus Saccharimonadales bacterium]|jgi:hypothetical protein
MNKDASPKPVAYTPEGQPLYAHPPAPITVEPMNPEQAQQAAAEGGTQPQVVYMTRAVDPHEPHISPEVRAKHDQSMKQYGYLNLSDGEYVISAIRRHPIGLLSIWAVVIIGMLAVLLGLPLLLFGAGLLEQTALSGQAMTSGAVVLLLTAVLFLLGGVVATVVYNANRFYLTNESVIQHIQTSLFTKKDQTISLANIEDASFRQQGILQTILNYGAIRLSTEGEETTYRFNFVANPKREVDRLNNAVEAFKNFRPVDSDNN